MTKRRNVKLDTEDYLRFIDGDTTAFKRGENNKKYFAKKIIKKCINDLKKILLDHNHEVIRSIGFYTLDEQFSVFENEKNYTYTENSAFIKYMKFWYEFVCEKYSKNYANGMYGQLYISAPPSKVKMNLTLILSHSLNYNVNLKKIRDANIGKCIQSHNRLLLGIEPQPISEKDNIRLYECTYFNEKKEVESGYYAYNDQSAMFYMSPKKSSAVANLKLKIKNHFKQLVKNKR